MEKILLKSGRKIKKAVYDPATNSTRTDAKGKIRERIESEVIDGQNFDIFDLIADMSKRLNVLERGLFLYFKTLKDNGELPASLSGYNDSIDYYITELMAGRYKARTDLVDDISDMHQELMRRDTKVTEILESEGY